ncbi:MAG: SGNH/GDSL hydrolase family protein [Anaeroplasmataceae bacterium]
MKKILSLFSFIFALFVLVSCSDDADDTPKVQLETPTVVVSGNQATWNSITNAKGYVVSIDGTAQPEQVETSYTLTTTEPGDYTIKVKAVAENSKTHMDSAFSTAQTLTIVDLNKLPTTTIWVVGDSTVCDYGKYDASGNKTGVTDATYFYDRYGYATQFSEFMSDKVTVNNLALSGRSSKSFTEETNYSTLTSKIKSGDYLVIGFGHNDEKSDDAARFASALESTETVGSFKYNLYNYYVKVAKDAGATPIICSPIVRASKTNDYTGSNGHITAAGNYAKACIELGEEKNVTVVDLTTLTKELYTRLGYDEAIYFHAMTSGSSATEPKVTSADTTHINIYGAKMVSYLFAKAIKDSTCSLKNYINQNLVEPTKAKDLVVNPYYTYKPYSDPDFAEYEAMIEAGKLDDTTGEYDTTAYDHFKTITDGWVGTAFGDVGGDPKNSGNGYVAKEVSAGVFNVGQGQSTGSTAYKGKIASATEGRGYVLQKISITKNFTFEADAKVINLDSGAGNQSGFGILVRDECYLGTGNDKSLGLGNSYNAGFVTTSSGAGVIYSRESGVIASTYAGTVSAYAVGSEAHLKIERVGQIVTCTVEYGGQKYEKQYIDVDLIGIDNDYMYVGMYGARGTIAEFTNVVLTITGESQGA